MYPVLLILSVLPFASFSNPLLTFHEENKLAGASDGSFLRLTKLKNVLTDKGLECSACKTIANILQELFVKNATEEEIVKIITFLCIQFKIEDELVCTAVVIEFKVFTHALLAGNHAYIIKDASYSLSKCANIPTYTIVLDVECPNSCNIFVRMRFCPFLTKSPSVRKKLVGYSSDRTVVGRMIRGTRLGQFDCRMFLNLRLSQLNLQR